MAWVRSAGAERSPSGVGLCYDSGAGPGGNLSVHRGRAGGRPAAPLHVRLDDGDRPVASGHITRVVVDAAAFLRLVGAGPQVSELRMITALVDLVHRLIATLTATIRALFRRRFRSSGSSPAQPVTQRRPHPGGMMAHPGEVLNHQPDAVQDPELR
jgi:hypothetical protein